MSAGIRHMLAAFDPTLPLERARTIPADWYFDRDLFELERRAVFGRTWQAVGPWHLVEKPGQFLTADVAGEPVAVVRGQDGVLRAFSNVCRHRASLVLTEPCGTAAKLRCQYHGWTYDLDGRLRGTPEFDGVGEFDKADHGLPPVAVAEWGPFVWVNLSADPEPVEAFLRPFPTWAADRRAFDNLVWHSSQVYDIECNWKVYVDNYLDGGYHVNTVHPALAGAIDYANYTTTPSGNTVLQSSPLAPATGTVGATRTGDAAAYWWVYPNVMVNVYGGVMDTNRVEPLGPDRCRVTFDYSFAAGTDERFATDSIAVADQVQVEDESVCVRVQHGLRSRTYTTGRFSVKRENGGYHFHRLLAAGLEAGLAADERR